MTNNVRAWHVYEAFRHVARVNHYLVGVVGTITRDELDAARQIAIQKQNEQKRGKVWNDLERTLDLMDHVEKDMNQKGVDTWQSNSRDFVQASG